MLADNRRARFMANRLPGRRTNQGLRRVRQVSDGVSGGTAAPGNYSTHIPARLLPDSAASFSTLHHRMNTMAKYCTRRRDGVAVDVGRQRRGASEFIRWGNLV